MKITIKETKQNNKQETLERLKKMIHQNYSTVLLKMDHHLFLLNNFDIDYETDYIIVLINLEVFEVVYKGHTNKDRDTFEEFEEDFLEELAETYKEIEIIDEDIEITL